MTKEQWSALGVPEEALQQVMDAHRQAMEDLRQTHEREREQWRQEQEHRDKRQALHAALRRMGAEDSAAELLARAVPEEEIRLNDRRELDNEKALLQPLKERYAVLFPQVRNVPAGEIHPPRSGYPPQKPDFARMSEEEINRSWSMVKSWLARE